MARCSRCGNEIPAWANGTCYNCVRYEVEHGGQSLPPIFKCDEPRSSLSSPDSGDAKSISIASSGLGNVRRGINALLQDIYRRPTFITALLSANNVAPDDIERLRKNIPTYYDALQGNLNDWLTSLFPLPAFNLLKKVYSLDGRPKTEIRDLVGMYDYSTQQLYEMHRNMLNHLQQKTRRSQLERLLVSTAKGVTPTGGGAPGRTNETSLSSKARDYLRIALGDPNVDFRDGQWNAIQSIVDGQERLLVVQRTGWGKSMVYFLATRLLRDQGRGPTLLVSPLLALMRNQIDAAQRIGIRAATINSSNTADWEAIRDILECDEIDILLISPERLANDDFREDFLLPIVGSVGLFVVDEAHCISDWGHDFRPDYRRITRILQLLPNNVPVLATTATANDRVVADVAEAAWSKFNHYPRHAGTAKPSLTKHPSG